MGVKRWITKAVGKAGDAVASASSLSPGQIEKMQASRDAYLTEMPKPDDVTARDLTERLMAASGVEVFSSYLPRISQLYLPISSTAEDGKQFSVAHNVRYFEITKWVTNKDEDSLEKLVNVYDVLATEECNIALVFRRECLTTKVYLAVVNTRNAAGSSDIDVYAKRLAAAVRGNFPGSEIGEAEAGVPECLSSGGELSVATATNVPAIKSEKFISQTIEKVLDGVIPEEPAEDYTIVLLATPVLDVENRKANLADFYSGLAPYASWQTDFTFNEQSSIGSSATVGVNVGVSAGIQNGQNTTMGNSQSDSQSEQNGTTDSTTDTSSSQTGTTETESAAESLQKSSSTTETDSVNAGVGAEVSGSTTSGVSASLRVPGGSIGANASQTVSKSVSAHVDTGHSSAQTAGQTIGESITKSTARSVSNGISNSVGRAVTSSLGRAVTNTVSKTEGIFKSLSLGANAGANFARSSNVTATVGKNEGIHQTFTNYSVKHALETLEEQMKRLDQASALGLWDFAAYVLSEDHSIANNVAHAYLALTQGEVSYLSQASVNVWRGDTDSVQSEAAEEICKYLRTLRHPVFGFSPSIRDAMWYAVDYTKKGVKDAEVASSDARNLLDDAKTRLDEGEVVECEERVREADAELVRAREAKEEAEAELRGIYAYPTVVTATTSLTGKELAYSLNFPKKSVPGLPVLECAEFARNVVTYAGQSQSGGLIIGHVFHMNRSEPTEVALSKDSLTSHVFVTGSTGAGKSNTVYQLLRAARKTGAHFLVVEPAKGEYKDVFSDDDGVQVYGTNPDLTPLLRLNPFSFPSGIHVLEHLDRLIEIFNVCWPMYAAMPAVLKDAVERSYVDCGWDLASSQNPFGDGLYPSFADVARNVRLAIDTSDYDAENKGAYKGSLLTRLRSLTTGINGMIFTADEVPADQLFEEDTIVDLSRVGSAETKSLLMGMIVLKLQEHRMTSGIPMNSGLRHMTVLEEAHNLLKRTSSEQPVEGGNLLGKSVEMIANAIAEMRTYGEGFVIADQAPGLLDMAAIRNTNTKIIMRLPDLTDRELVGRAANLNDNQIAELAKLPRGVAAVYQNEWVQPVLCRVDYYKTPGSRYKKLGGAGDLPAGQVMAPYRAYLAKLLSSGARIDREVILSDIRPRLRGMGIDASAQVGIMKFLENPPTEPRMTKLGPVMSALFPGVRDSVKSTYAETNSVTDWTASAEAALQAIVGRQIEDQVRRDIVQAVITDYVFIELGRRKELERWANEGGLR